MGGCKSKQNKIGIFCWKKHEKSKSNDEVEIKEISQNNCKTVTSTCEENSKETPKKIESLSHQDSLNEVIKASENKLCYNEKNDIFEEIENKSHENKAENIPTRVYVGNTKSKIRDSKETYFASFYETKPTQYQIIAKKKMVNKWIEEIFNDIILEIIILSEIKNDIAKEILDTFLLQETLEIVRKKVDNELIRELVGDVITNAIHAVEKIASEKLVSRKPLGFANPKGYCYLNSVVQVLGSCEEFKRDIYLYNLNTIEKTKDSIFVEGLFNLIKAIRECNEKNLNKSLDIVQQNITESSFGDDVYKCFMNLLTRVSNVIKTDLEKPSDPNTSLLNTFSEKAETNFTRFKKRNPGFVFDNFYGQLTFQTVCKLCKHICNESFQMIKSLPLPVPNSNNSETLNSCVDLFFNESDVEVDEPMTCECKTGKTMSLKSISKLTHGPKYLFIYLNRGSYTDDGLKNDTNVTCDNLTINIKTFENLSIKYKLISVIDHIGDSAYGHYYCKCSFESEQWWLLNDSQVDRIKNKKDIVTKNTIVFLFKKKQQSNL